MEQKLYDFWLCSRKGIGLRKRERLLRHFGSPEEIFFASEEQYRQVKGINEKDIASLSAGRSKEAVREEYDRLARQGISFVSVRQDGFPEKLKQIADAPYGLYYRGNLPDEKKPCVAVVGARDASFEGMQIARKFGYELAANGIQVISGMARGIDIHAQRGALDYAGGSTYSVLGTGADVCYPRQHIEEYMLMQEHGGVITEFPPASPSLPFQFAMRNRIISGLSDGVLLIEAGEKSGSLITAETGLEQGREIFVVPGGILDSRYKGGNKLLKQGAAPVTCVSDILDGLGIFLDAPAAERMKKSDVMLETTEKIVYASLGLEPVHVSCIAEQTGLPLQNVMEILLALQVRNMVDTVGNNYFVIRL